MKGLVGQKDVPERPDGESALLVAPIPRAVGADDAVLLPAAERLAAVGAGGRGVVEEVDVDVAQVDEFLCLLKIERARSRSWRFKVENSKR